MGDKATTAGAKHGSNAGVDRGDDVGVISVGYIAGYIVLGMKNGNIRLLHSPQGDEVEVSEATLAGLLVDVFFTDKFEGQYETVKNVH